MSQRQSRIFNSKFQQVVPETVKSNGSLEESIDPRSNFYNLIDGVNNTKDDIHSWLRKVFFIFQYYRFPSKDHF